MIYRDNKQVKREFKKVVVDNDIKMKEVANRLNITPQQLNNRFANSRFALSDLKVMLDCIGYDLQIEFVKKEDHE